MAASFGSGDQHSSLYSKSLEIFQLTRKVSHYIVYDLAPIQRNGKDDPHIYIAGDIVQQSISLGPEILKAENHTFRDDRYRYATSALILSNRLYRNCKQLQRANSNGKDFLPLIISELRKFRKQLHIWRLTL